MGEINGTFIFNGKPRNGATAKLWDKADLVWDDFYGNILLNPSFETGDPPDDWTLGGSGASRSRSATDPKIGSYCAYLTNSSPNEAYLEQHPTPSTYEGLTVTMGAWVKCSTATRARVVIYDNNGGGYEASGSSYHTGSGLWEWLSVTRTLRTGLTDLIFRCQIISGSTISAYFDGVIGCIAGEIITEPGDTPATPWQDAYEPAAGQVGSAVTTGLDYGGDGAFRFESVPAGDYYVSVEYDGKRAWIYAGEININSLMTTQGDMVRKGSGGAIERVAAGSEGAMFHISSGLPAWTA